MLVKMNMLKLLKHFLLFCLLVSLSAQQDNFPQLTPGEIDYGEITRTEFYNGEELWGLINGGADLYLEYGLDKTLLQEVVVDDKNYRVEIYGMNDEDAAFGIYSIRKFNCVKTDTLVEYICITPYQVQAAVGKYYISISNQSGDANSEKYTIYLFEQLLKRIDYTTYTLPEYFNKSYFESYRDQIKFIRGRLGLQNGFVRWEKFFYGYHNYEITILPVKIDTGYINLAQINFESEDETERFITNNTQTKNGKIFKKVESISPKEIIFVETNLDNDNLENFLTSK